MFFFLHVLLLFLYGLGRGKLLIKFVSLNRILKGGAAEGCFNGLGELHVSMDLISELSGLSASLGWTVFGVSAA